MGWERDYAEGKYAEARAKLEAMASAGQANGEPALYLGALRALLDEDRTYLDAAAKAAASSVPKEDIMSLIGCTLWDMGLHAEGAAKLREAIAISLTAETIVLAAARFETTPGMGDEAIELYDKLLTREPENVDALTRRGFAKMKKALAFLDEAKYDIETALRKDPQNPEAHFDLAGVYVLKGDFEEGLTHYEASCAGLGKRVHPAYAGAAKCLFILGRLEEAEAAAQESLRLSPEYGYAKDLVAQIEIARGRGTPV